MPFICCFFLEIRVATKEKKKKKLVSKVTGKERNAQTVAGFKVKLSESSNLSDL